MGQADSRAFTHSWEEAILALRDDPAHRDLIFFSYLTADLSENARRFAASAEFSEVLRLLRSHAPGAKTVLDIPGGNGIASHAFAQAGFVVTTVEPDASDTVGRGAINAVMTGAGLFANIVNARGEELPFPDAGFDIVYVRQGLHHAADLPGMARELARVLRPGGVLLACREHVVDNYGASLETFLASQADHQLYGGEHAYTLADYQRALTGAGLTLKHSLGQVDSVINLYPRSWEDLYASILKSPPGRILSGLLPRPWIIKLGLWRLKRKKVAGRLYSFVAVKPGALP